MGALGKETSARFTAARDGKRRGICSGVTRATRWLPEVFATGKPTHSGGGRLGGGDGTVLAEGKRWGGPEKMRPRRGLAVGDDCYFPSSASKPSHAQQPRELTWSQILSVLLVKGITVFCCCIAAFPYLCISCKALAVTCFSPFHFAHFL